jgi:glycosyltransferase involved in cell wall biosynthesis
LETIVEAALLLRDRTDICFFLIGDGSRAAWIREQIEKHTIKNIIMLGSHPLESMPNFFAKASALLVTLKEDYIFSLTIPSKVQDYLAAGRPIIAALNGEGSRLILEAGAGLACPASDGPALAEAVTQLADMPEASRQAMGEAGRRYCESHFDQQRLTNELIAILKNLKSNPNAH